jgi:hypothetical protein
MKKIIIGLLALSVLPFIYLQIEGNKMQEVKTQIDISAPPSKVWEIITNINEWEHWSPVIIASQGDAAIGSELKITMIGKEEGKDGPTYKPVIIESDEHKYFRWRAHMLAGFIFTNDKTFTLEQTSFGTRLTHTESFKGMLTPLFSGQMAKGVPPILNSMNKALKELAEK